jgi:hypothetical protein
MVKMQGSVYSTFRRVRLACSLVMARWRCVRQQRGHGSRRWGAKKLVMTMVKRVGGEDLTKDDISN